MPQGKGYSKGQLDAMAREKGFPDYATWSAWNKKYRSASRNGAPQEKPRNFLQSLASRIPGHPAHTLTKAKNKMKEATERRK
jgi:hypothetical protein